MIMNSANLRGAIKVYEHAKKMGSSSIAEAALVNLGEYATRTCEWQVAYSEYMPGTYETDCKNTFSFVEGGLEENNFKFCPYCGGKIK